MHPDVGEPVASRARLGQLVLVMREAQVEPTAVDVEILAEVLRRHGRALDVPARSAPTPRSRPRGGAGLAGFVRLPQSEVPGVLLAPHVRIVRGFHVLEALVGQFPIVRPRGGREVDIAAVIECRVGIPRVDESIDEFDHLGDVPGGAGFVAGWQHVEGGIGLGEGPLVFEGVGEPGSPLLGGFRQDLVVDVRDVAD